MRSPNGAAAVFLLAGILLISVVSVARAQWVPDGVGVCTADGEQNWPVSIADGDGGAIIAWRDDRSGNLDIYVQRVDASGSGRWATDGVALCTAPGDQEAPAIATDGAGGAIVTWPDLRSGDQDIYAQRVDANGTVLWASNGVAICAATGNQYEAQSVSDSAGGAIITWTDERNGNSNADIYAQRVDAFGGILWTLNGVAVSEAAEGQSTAQIISDGAGGAMITWEDYRSGNQDVYVQRVNANGTALWAEDGEAVCTATGDQVIPEIASDGAGGAIVTWKDSRSGNNDIYAQRITGDGRVLGELLINA